MDPWVDRLQSDLDLTVKIGAAELHGNMPIGSKDFDRTNMSSKSFGRTWVKALGSSDCRDVQSASRWRNVRAL